MTQSVPSSVVACTTTNCSGSSSSMEKQVIRSSSRNHPNNAVLIDEISLSDSDEEEAVNLKRKRSSRINSESEDDFADLITPSLSKKLCERVAKV